MKKMVFGLGLIILSQLLVGCDPQALPSTLEIGQIYTQPVDNTPFKTESPLASPSSTPYVTVFSGYFYCRAEPSTSSEMLVLLQGQEVIIIAKNQDHSWLYITVQYFDRPCWVSITANHNLNPDDVALVPLYENLHHPVFFTFTPPIGTPTSGPGTDHPSNDPTSKVPNTSTPQPTQTFVPSETFEPSKTPDPTRTPNPTTTPCLNPQGKPIPCHP